MKHIIGVEMNKELCDIQRKIIKDYSMEERVMVRNSFHFLFIEYNSHSTTLELLIVVTFSKLLLIMAEVTLGALPRCYSPQILLKYLFET